jgi:hypothetical protein
MISTTLANLAQRMDAWAQFPETTLDAHACRAWRDQLVALAEEVAAIERAPIPPGLGARPSGPNVVCLDTERTTRLRGAA